MLERSLRALSLLSFTSLSDIWSRAHLWIHGCRGEMVRGAPCWAPLVIGVTLCPSGNYFLPCSSEFLTMQCWPLSFLLSLLLADAAWPWLPLWGQAQGRLLHLTWQPSLASALEPCDPAWSRLWENSYGLDPASGSPRAGPDSLLRTLLFQQTLPGGHLPLCPGGNPSTVTTQMLAPNSHRVLQNCRVLLQRKLYDCQRRLRPSLQVSPPRGL